MCKTIIDMDKTYTYHDYCKWSENNNIELINGKPNVIPLVPEETRQELIVAFTSKISPIISSKSLTLICQPFEIRLNDSTVVKPDLALISDLSKLNGNIYSGTPDIIIEIFPESLNLSDQFLLKYPLYEASGVKEFWSVDPFGHEFNIFLLESDGYWGESFSSGMLPSIILEGASIDLSNFFPNTTDLLDQELENSNSDFKLQQ
jgi:Uma2 family endonuclease